MLFTKEDRQLLFEIRAILEGLCKQTSSEVLLMKDNRPISHTPFLDYVKKHYKESNKEEETKVSGNMDLSSVAEDEEDEVRESIAARFAKQEGGAFFEEEDLNARELEIME